MLKILLIAIAMISYTGFSQGIADKIITKANDARGGEEALKNIENWDIDMTITNKMAGVSNNLKLKFKGDEAFYVEQGENKFMHNGTEGWYIAPQNQVTEYAPLEEPILSQVKQQFIQQLTSLQGILVGLKDNGLECGFLGKEELDGEKVNKLSIKGADIPEEQEFAVLIGANDNLVKKLDISSPQGKSEIHYKDYIKVGKFQFPQVIENKQNGQTAIEIKINKIAVNQEFAPKTFDKPAK